MYVPFSIFIFFFLTRDVASSPALSQLIVTRVGPCLDRRPSEVMTVSEMSLRKESSGTVLSGPMRIHKNIDNGWAVKTTMQKCHDIRNIDTCDYYKAWVNIRGGCEDPSAKNMDTFVAFAKYVTPRLSCPIKAGNYTINKYQFFTTGSVLITAEAKISTSVFGYTFRLEGFNEEDDRLFCVDSNLRMVYIRKHDWIGAQKFEEEVPSTEDATRAPATDDDDEESDGADQIDGNNNSKDATGKSNGKTDGELDGGSDETETNGKTENNDEDDVTKDELGETKSISTKRKEQPSEPNDEDDEMVDVKDVGVQTNDGGATKDENDKTDDANETEGEENETGDEASATKDKDGNIKGNAEPSNAKDGGYTDDEDEPSKTKDNGGDTEDEDESRKTKDKGGNIKGNAEPSNAKDGGDTEEEEEPSKTKDNGGDTEDEDESRKTKDEDGDTENEDEPSKTKDEGGDTENEDEPSKTKDEGGDTEDEEEENGKNKDILVEEKHAENFPTE